jgi:hypothetical protein
MTYQPGGPTQKKANLGSQKTQQLAWTADASNPTHNFKVAFKYFVHAIETAWS